MQEVQKFSKHFDKFLMMINEKQGRYRGTERLKKKEHKTSKNR